MTSPLSVGRLLAISAITVTVALAAPAAALAAGSGGAGVRGGEASAWSPDHRRHRRVRRHRRRVVRGYHAHHRTYRPRRRYIRRYPPTVVVIPSPRVRVLRRVPEVHVEGRIYVEPDGEDAPYEDEVAGPDDGQGEDGYPYDEELAPDEPSEDGDASDDQPAPAPEARVDIVPDEPGLEPSGNTMSSAERRRLEGNIQVLINQERADAGLTPLKMDRSLRKASRGHSDEMISLNYFSHTSPVEANRTLGRRIQNAGVRDFGKAGENIAMQTRVDDLASTFVRMWMDSPGHRENILTGDFRFTGIGVSSDGSRVYATQLFSEKGTPR